MHVFRSSIIDEEINLVWNAVRNFDSVVQWNPGIVSAKLETGSPTGCGAIRKLVTGDGAIFRETLVAHSDVEYLYSYDILISPLPIINYISTHRFYPITHTRQTLSVWEGRFSCDPEHTHEMKKTNGDAIYINGMIGLNNFLKESKND